MALVALHEGANPSGIKVSRPKFKIQMFVLTG